MKYEIVFLETTPVRLAPYRLPPPKMQYFRGHIENLLRDVVIEPSLSNYSSPMFLVPKPGEAYRAVVDYVLIFRLSFSPCAYPSPSAKEGPGACSGGSVLVHKKTRERAGLEN
jgi:hypothetical protein